jgi:hypothetical protein
MVAVSYVATAAKRWMLRGRDPPSGERWLRASGGYGERWRRKCGGDGGAVATGSGGYGERWLRGAVEAEVRR